MVTRARLRQLARTAAARAWASLRRPRQLPFDRWDGLVGAGALLVAYGARQIYRPAGAIALGVLLITFGLLGAARPPRAGEP
jgi:hypothetical protein